MSVKDVSPNKEEVTELIDRLNQYGLSLCHLQDVIEDFTFELLGTPWHCQRRIHIRYSKVTGEWNVSEKSIDRSNIRAYNTYGTGRINAYKIIEDTLNLRDVRIFDTVQDADGHEQRVLNKKETAIAQSKQELIKQGFQDWVWRDPARREKAVPDLQRKV